MKTLNQKIKISVSVFIFLFINFAFYVKYLSRVTSYYLTISSILIVIFYVFLKFRSKINIPKAFHKIILFLMLFLFLTGSGFVFYKIPVESLNVDRWSVITSFWDNFFKGEYVYYAKSTMGNPPGPMPFYYILAFPFYYIGELGWYSVLGFIMFYSILIYSKKTFDIRFLFLLLIFTSPFYLWEVTTRSNIFLNGSLVLFSIVYLFKSLETNHFGKLLFNGVIIGLLLSTRNVFVIPYIITFLFILKDNRIKFLETIYIGIVAIIIFALTFLPFIWNHLSDFMTMNPFLIQSGYLMPTEYSFFCIILSLGSFWICKEKSDVYFFSGLLLFFTIVLHYLYQMSQYGFIETFFNSRADISYFILCIPFFLYFLVDTEYKTNKVKFLLPK
jgi:hypothetical protein